jgi:ABC-type antimicrobial peptide transport system permease subunit
MGNTVDTLGTAASLVELLRHGAWVRRLARSLTGRSDADDLVQETWLAALKHPPRDDQRLVLFLLGAFAALAVVLAALGIYGVVSYSVTQRTREIGVRMALGASPSGIRTMIVRQGLRLCLLGLLIGVAAALLLTRLLAGQLFGVSPSDPLTFLALAALILAVSAAGSLIPAVRATRVDPMIALRTE